MRMNIVMPLVAILTAQMAGCASTPKNNLAHFPFHDAQAVVREAINQIHRHVETASIDALRDGHLQSEKFSKFGGQRFDRMNIEQCNQQEAADITSMEEVEQHWDDLKIDVFGDVAIATGYIQISFKMNGNDMQVHVRATVVFLKTKDGWKIVHEHVTPKRCFDEGSDQ